MSESTLREVVETLAPLERGAGSEGEAQAARWLADRLRAAGAPARVESVEYRDGYARLLGPLGTTATIAGAVALTGRGRKLAALIGGLAALAIADDVDNRRRVWRRIARRPRPTTNVVAEVGDLAADRTLVVLAHHDAAPTGWIFDQSLQRAIARRFPAVIARANASLPLWWPIIGAPLLVSLGAIANRRGLLAVGTATGAMTCVVGIDLSRHRIVPGANDNLSAVAALVDLAERIRDRPIDGLRIVLASCGAEEVLQGGIYDFVDRHLRPLDPAGASVLNLDTIGSPRLVLLEGEGVLKIEDYPDPSFRDLIADTAAAVGIPLVRGQRARSSTDSVIPSRAGYPTATVTSFEPDTKLLSNYHLPTDTPENLDFETVREGVDLTEALARRLATA
jgi:Peptidase family M28